MFGADYIWILQENLGGPWWRNATECSQKDLIAAVESVLVVKSFNKIVGNDVSISGLVYIFFKLLSNQQLKMKYNYI